MTLARTLGYRIERVAVAEGDGLGDEVFSFEENGREYLTEVRTTAFCDLTPLFVSRNELGRSKADAERYRLYRLFDFRDWPRAFDRRAAIAELSARCGVVRRSDSLKIQTIVTAKPLYVFAAPACCGRPRAPIGSRQAKLDRSTLTPFLEEP